MNNNDTIFKRFLLHFHFSYFYFFFFGKHFYLHPKVKVKIGKSTFIIKHFEEEARANHIFHLLPASQDARVCEEPLLGLIHLNDGTDRRRVPLQNEDHPGNDLLGSWFSAFVFRNVPGTVPERVRICGFQRKSSNLDRAPKMRESVLLNSWDSFLVTLPSISSEKCVIYSSLSLGTDVFPDWPFLGCSSCVSFVTAANFPLFLNVAIFLEEKCYEY